MSVSEVAPDPLGNEYDQYRILSLWSVAGFVLGILALLAIAIPALLVLPIMGVLVSGIALYRIARGAGELTGRKLAIAGMILNASALIIGTSIATAIYLTEVPEGYRRISFADFRPRGEEIGRQIPSAALQLDGQRIFVKGYVLSDDKTSGLKDFVLVPDMGTCCFGGQPKLTDMIEVTLEDPLRIKYSWHLRKLGGTLRVDPRYKREDGSDGGHYKLRADYVR